MWAKFFSTAQRCAPAVMTMGSRRSIVLMEAGGLYSENNPNSFSTVRRAIPVVRAAVASTGFLEDSSTFTFCDFGTADGGAGAVVAKAVVDHVKSINKSKPVHIVFEDQAENDFSPILTKHQRTISNGIEDVFVSVVGRSFYKQCLPPESVDLSFCSTATHWPDFDVDADHDKSLAFTPIGTGLKWIKESKNSNDWERFLLHRTHELKKNGRLVVLHVVFPSDGDKELSPSDKAYNMLSTTFSTFFEVYEELQNEGRLNPDENFSYAAKYRTTKELEEPFLEISSPIHQAGLSLCSIEKIAVPCPNTKLFQEGKLSKKEYAQALTLSMKTWSSSIVFDSLTAQRSNEGKQGLVKEIYARLEKSIAAKVPNVGHPYPMAIVVAKKRELRIMDSV